MKPENTEPRQQKGPGSHKQREGLTWALKMIDDTVQDIISLIKITPQRCTVKGLIFTIQLMLNRRAGALCYLNKA